MKLTWYQYNGFLAVDVEDQYGVWLTMGVGLDEVEALKDAQAFYWRYNQPSNIYF